MPQMNFDLEDGKPPVSFALKPEDCARFISFMHECEEGKKDAERYRWLRDQHTYDGEGDSDMTRWYVQAGREPVPCDPGALDAEIDAAMAARVGAA